MWSLEGAAVAGRALAVGVEKLSRAQPTVRVRPGAGLDACPCQCPGVLTEASQAVCGPVRAQQCERAWACMPSVHGGESATDALGINRVDLS